jgi:23S rRNA G2069 N7-methylase RlmK/C1962 C5-methylase RlmI
VIIADPPAFIKRKKDLKNGEAAYRRLNEQAMRLLSKDGILVSASCSMHLPEDDLQNILLAAPATWTAISNCSNAAARARTTRCTWPSRKPATSRA